MEKQLIDRDDALARFAGNEAIFKVLLGKFVATTHYDDLLRLLAEGDIENAERAAHTIKGTAGNLSLGALFASATDLDAILKVNGDYQATLDEMKAIYTETIVAVQAYLAE